MALSKRWIFAAVACAALVGCDQAGKNAAQEAEAENLALFKTSEERCWRYLGGILASRDFRVAQACAPVVFNKAIQPGSESGQARKLEKAWQEEMEVLKKTAGGKTLGKDYSEIISLIDNEKNAGARKNILKESGKKYKNVCEKSIGIAVRTSIKNIKSSVCNDSFLEEFCIANSHDLFKLKSYGNGIYLNMVKNSIFEKYFMTGCLLANPNGWSSLENWLAKMEKSVTNEVEGKVSEFLKETKDKTAEILKDPKTWKFVAKIAFTVALVALF